MRVHFYDRGVRLRARVKGLLSVLPGVGVVVTSHVLVHLCDRGSLEESRVRTTENGTVRLLVQVRGHTVHGKG